MRYLRAMIFMCKEGYYFTLNKNNRIVECVEVRFMGEKIIIQRIADPIVYTVDTYSRIIKSNYIFVHVSTIHKYANFST